MAVPKILLVTLVLAMLFTAETVDFMAGKSGFLGRGPCGVFLGPNWDMKPDKDGYYDCGNGKKAYGAV